MAAQLHGSGASPIWSGHPHLFARVLAKLPADALLESWGLIAIAVESYWNAGLIRLLQLAHEFIPDARRERVLPRGSVVVAGENDPFTEWELFPRYGAERVVRVPGGPHGVQYSYPEAVAAAVLSS